MGVASQFLSSPTLLFTSAFLLRAALLLYGVYQDSVSALKYTDIDYYVFTDAAKAVARGSSPYDRATYRYTPLLAWILLPTTWGGLWFQFGKAVFAMSDLVAGWLMIRVLQRKGLNQQRSLHFAAVWLLNPMVANISTRGSSEGFLCAIVVALLWAFESDRFLLASILLGFSVHFKIYPFIYGISMLLALNPDRSSSAFDLRYLLTKPALTLLSGSIATFAILNTLMYFTYGYPFLRHTFFHHITRIDHRHNFSPYNTLLYLSSASPSSSNSRISFESLAFVPQLLLTLVLIPLATARIDLPATLLAQTLAFVTFNKVCTSQYFLWYLVFLPLYLPNSTFLQQPKVGVTALVLWVLGQALWLQQGYELEFLGRSTFVPGLWLASFVFFAVNCWILGVVVANVISKGGDMQSKVEKAPVSKRRAGLESKLAGSVADQGSREDTKASVSGTSIGKINLAPRGKVLKSQ